MQQTHAYACPMVDKHNGEIFLAQSEDGSHSILIDENARQPPWITRRDLHAWVWAQPIAIVTETFSLSESVGWLCWIYGVGRPPPGHWARKRAGKPSETEPLNPDRDPDESVPLVDFEFNSSFPRMEARCPAKFPPYARIGPPSGDALLYPSKTRLSVTGFDSIHDLHLKPLLIQGPPPPMSRGHLYDIVWKMDDAQVDHWLNLYGISRRLAFQISYEYGIGTLRLSWMGVPFEHRWSIEDKYILECRPNLSDVERAMLIDLSPVEIEAHQAIVEQEDAAAADRRQAKLSLTRALTDSQILRGVRQWSALMERMSLGESFTDATITEKINFPRMAWAFGMLANERIPEVDIESEWQSIMNGEPTAQAMVLFGQLCTDLIRDDQLK